MRITPEQVVEAYKATGLKPAQYLNFDGSCACGLVTLSRHRTHSPVKDPSIACDLLGLEYDYGAGFIHGWDDDSYMGAGSKRDGYTDGQAAWQACVDAGLVTGESE